MNQLFSPFKVGSLNLANRVVMAPMTRNKSPGNIPNAEVMEYYRKRAAGGVGLILTEGTCIGHKAANGYADVPCIAGEAALAGWAKVVTAVHAQGGKIAPQLWHVGGIRKSGVEPGGDLPGYSPSGMAFPGKITGHAMTKEDIQQTVDAYVQAAVDAERIGFDAVEIHAAHGYLIDQFFWEATNRRDDEYGGSMYNRSRFACEIVAGIRAAVSDDFPIIFRYSQWKLQDYSARLAETPQNLALFLAPLTAAGVDIYHCSTRRYWEPEFVDSNLNLAGWTKKITGKPSITVGSVGLNADFLPAAGDVAFKNSKIASLDKLIERMNAGEFDLVAVGRALIANPDWAIKVRTASDLTPFDTSMLLELN